MDSGKIRTLGIIGIFAAIVNGCGGQFKTTSPESAQGNSPPQSTCTESGYVLQDGICMETTENNSLVMQPATYQVFQRHSLTRGQLRVSLNGMTSTDKISIVISSGSATLSTVAEDVNLLTNSIYKRLIDLPAGGWYSVEIRQIDLATNKIIRSVISKVGIGDVFVTAGQSNSVNAGEELTQPASGLVVAFDPKTNIWGIADDPQPGYYDNGYGTVFGGSTWPTMGDVLAGELNVPIAMVETGFAGSAIAQWQKGAPEGHFDRLKTIVQQIVAQSGGLRMILWHQGESDAAFATSTLDYQNRFTQMKADLSADLSYAAIPWMVAKASFFPLNLRLTDGLPCDSQVSNVQGGQNVIAAQTKLIADSAAHEGPSTDDLSGPLYRYPGLSGACVHFTKAGTIAVGQRWGDRVVAAPFSPYIAQPTAALRDEVYRAKWYLQNHSDLDVFESNLFLATYHWLFVGIAGGRQGSATFYSVDYLANNPEVAQEVGATNYLGAIQHYIDHL